MIDVYNRTSITVLVSVTFGWHLFFLKKFKKRT
nr:MAG TPA: hypothetical protein [Caudoviricetes sp.]